MSKNPNPRKELAMKTMIIGERIGSLIQKRRALHTKNPYSVKKPDIFKEKIRSEKILDGFYLLDKSGCDLPHEVITVRLSSKNITDCVENDLNYFINLIELDLSENVIKDIQKLAGLKALERLHLQNNGIENINFNEFRFLEKLMFLDLSYNALNPSTIVNLSYLPALKELNLSGNELVELPNDFSNFESLEVINLSSNKFLSDHTASRLWAHLASIRKLRELDISRNFLRGIHTEKLVSGDFDQIEKIDISHNRCENQHNLICARNFKNLKVLIVTGNPFAVSGQHKGLETELYTRVGAILINETVGLPYLKTHKKTAKPPIRFHNLFTLEPDKLVEEAKPTFFGVTLPNNNAPVEEEEMESPEKVADEDEDEDIYEEQEAAKFFLTEDQKPSSAKVSKKVRNLKPIEQKSIKEETLEKGSVIANSGELSIVEPKGSGVDNSPVLGPSPETTQTNIDLKGVKNMQDFKKAAATVIGESKEYDNPMELQSAYKMLKHIVNKPSMSIGSFDSRVPKTSFQNNMKKVMVKVGPTVKYRYNVGEAKMMDVERMIDTLNKKFLTDAKNEGES